MTTVSHPPTAAQQHGSTAARLIIGIVLLYAGFLKATGPVAEFAALIQAYKIIPSDWAMVAAMLLPYLEMGLAMFLLAGFETRRSAMAAAGFFGLFILAIGSTFLRGINLASCGCFGPDTLNPKITILLDAALLAMCLWLARSDRHPLPLSIDHLLSSPSRRRS